MLRSFHLTALLSVAGLHLTCLAQAGTIPTITPATLPLAAVIDDRFQSYNIEMVEVTGGRFWKPYPPAGAPGRQPDPNLPPGGDPSLFEYRPPIDLSNTRLRKLAAALGPSYVRISGTWRNVTYFSDSEGAAPSIPPTGFEAVLTRPEWKGVIDFARAVDAQVVTSFAVSAGTRDANGVWTPDQARKLIDYTNVIGGHFAAVEFMNEPNISAGGGGAPKGYDAAAFARDLRVFMPFARKAMPGTLILGPSAGGEATDVTPGSKSFIPSAALLTASGPVFDAISYHTYGAVSSRCAVPGAPDATTASAALSSEWLERAEHIEEFYARLRDRFEPGKQLWNTETAQAACGGDRWASTFLDSFRYLNQLGSLARRGVQANMHNTLAASDYALLDPHTYAPRPNYWSALLWRRIMGSRVLDAGPTHAPQLYVYAHCLRNHAGGVALLAINADPNASRTLNLPVASDRFTLTAPELESRQVLLNGIPLQLAADDSIPDLHGQATAKGKVDLPPASITFFTIEGAENEHCR